VQNSVEQSIVIICFLKQWGSRKPQSWQKSIYQIIKISCKVLLIGLLTLISMQTFAQKFGIQAGPNLSTMVWKDNDETYSDDLEMNLGFNAGVTFEIGFGSIMALQTCCFLTFLYC
jgi:hypothetical protein